MKKRTSQRKIWKKVSAFVMALAVMVTSFMWPSNLTEAKAAAYVQVGASAGFNSNFVFTTGINPAATTAYFADTGAVVHNSTRVANPAGDVIKIPNGFLYYDGSIYDVYFKIVNKEFPAGAKWKFQNSTQYFVLEYATGMSRDFTFTIWLQKGNEKVTDVDLIAGSCYTAASEAARPWSDDGKIYTNIPSPTSNLSYNSEKKAWTPNSSSFDKPTYYILGHGHSGDGSINGGYFNSGNGGCETVLGYLVYNVNFVASGNFGTFDRNQIKVAVDKQIAMPKITYGEDNDFAYWTVNKDVTLMDGTVKTAGSHLAYADIEKIRVTADLTVTAYAQSHNWSYVKNTEGDTITMVCANNPCSVEPAPEFALKAKDDTYTGKIYSLDNVSFGDSYGNFLKYTKKLYPTAPSSIAKSDVVFYVRVDDEENHTSSWELTTPENSGSLSPGTAPRDIGYYKAQVNIYHPDSRAAEDLFVDSYFAIEKKANYEHESLNNLQSQEYENENQVGVKVVNTNINEATALRIHLSDIDDQVSLVKIADLNWDAKNQTYGELQWVPEVKSWNTTHFSGSVPSAYKNPNTMADALTPEAWSDYFNALLRGESSAIATKGLNLYEGTYYTRGEGDGTPTPNTLIENKEYSYTVGDNNEPIVKITNLSFGAYAVLAKKSSDGDDPTYNVTIVNIVPEQTGPLDSWFILYEYDAYLKERNATIDKEINGRQVDTVASGDRVRFSVDFGLVIPKDRSASVEGSTTQLKDYTLYFEDMMSKAFDMDLSSIKLTGHYSNGTTVDLTAANNNGGAGYTYKQFVNADYSGVGAASAVAVESAADLYNSESYTTLSSAKYLERTGSLYTIGATTTRVNPDTGNTDKVYRIDFNVGALKAFMKETGNAISKITIEYEAVVTKDIEIKSEKNTNKAILYYEKNNTGSIIGTIEDTVRAYTYGINIIKMDGDTVDTDNVKYLDETYFWMFEETDMFVNGDWVYAAQVPEVKEYTEYDVLIMDPGTTEANRLEAVAAAKEAYVQARVDAYNQGKAEDDPTRITVDEFKRFTAGEGEKSYSTIFPEETRETYYYVDETYEEDTPKVLDDGTIITKGNKITYVFKRYIFEDNKLEVETVDNADGILIHGLDANRYIVVENLPKQGYNKLAEDIMVSITELSQAEAEANFAGSLKFFKNTNVEGFNEEGIEVLEVLNYSGLVLPSTGGMGTMIFTIIGVIILGGGITVAATRKRKNYMI